MDTWEEIDLIANPTAGVVDDGWPCYEGAGAPAALRQPEPRDLREPVCCGRRCRQRPVLHVQPLVRRGHGRDVPHGERLVDLRPGVLQRRQLPGELHRRPVLQPTTRATASGSCRRSRTAARTLARSAKFIDAAAGPVYLTIGPGGDLFYVDYDGGTIHRLTYAGSGNQPPSRGAVREPDQRRRRRSRSRSRGPPRPTRKAARSTYAWDFDGNGTDDATTATDEPHLHDGRHLPGPPAGDRSGRPVGQQDRHDHRGQHGARSDHPVARRRASPMPWATRSRSRAARPTSRTARSRQRLSWTLIVHHCPTSPTTATRTRSRRSPA